MAQVAFSDEVICFSPGNSVGVIQLKSKANDHYDDFNIQWNTRFLSSICRLKLSHFPNLKLRPLFLSFFTPLFYFFLELLTSSAINHSIDQQHASSNSHTLCYWPGRKGDRKNVVWYLLHNLTRQQRENQRKCCFFSLVLILEGMV